MKKLIFSALMLFATVFALACNPSHAYDDDGFDDVARDHWAYRHIIDLKGKGIIAGYPDGTFRPDENVTRTEFAAIIVKALDLYDKGDFYPFQYKDVSENYWGYGVIQLATRYGLVTGTPDGYFLPNDPVRRIEVMMVIMNTLALNELSFDAASEYLSSYEDAEDVPAWAVERAGKCQQLNMMATRPEFDGKLMPMAPATRAEIVVFVYNMLERVKIHPNKKIASELPKMADGYVLDNVYLDGSVAIIPAGTRLPLGIMTHTDSKEAQIGDVFIARALKHFVNKDSILLIPVGTRFVGKVEKVRKGMPIVRNAEMMLVLSNVLDESGEPASVFPAVADTKPVLWHPDNPEFWNKFGYYVWKGRNFVLHRSQIKEFILLEPVKVDVMNNWIYQ